MTDYVDHTYHAGRENDDVSDMVDPETGEGEFDHFAHQEPYGGWGDADPDTAYVEREALARIFEDDAR